MATTETEGVPLVGLRLTDAINTPAGELHGVPRRERKVLPVVLPRNAESLQGVSEHGASPQRDDESPPRGDGERTPNRRARKDYNTYMKGYMTRRRAK